MDNDFTSKVIEYIRSSLVRSRYVFICDLANVFGFGGGLLLANDGEIKTCLSSELADSLNVLISSGEYCYGIDTSKYIKLRYGSKEYLNFSINDMLDDTTFDVKDSPAFLSLFIMYKSSGAD
jgi:hypothetical protein